MSYPQSNKMLLAALDEYVSGHTEAKKALIVLLSRSKLRAFQRFGKAMEKEFLVHPMKVLLIGASGTGKTHLVESLQRISAFPLIKLDATQLNPTGASGGIKVKDLKNMIYTEAVRICEEFPLTYPYVEYAIERSVVYVDEVDKLGQNFESSGNWNRHVQSNYLTMFDNKDEYAGVSYIFSGAFDSITRDSKTVSKSIGFTDHNKTYKESKELIDTLVLKSGLIPELVGRLNAIVELDVFGYDELYDILRNRILPKKKMDLAAHGIFDVYIKKSEVKQIIDDCIKSCQGVRYLQRAIDRKFLDLEFEADSQEDLLYLPTDYGEEE